MLRGVDCLPTKAPDHPDLIVTKFFGIPKVRMVSMIGELATSVKFGVYNSNISTMTRAVLERVFYVKQEGSFQEPPQPISQQTFNTRMYEFEMKLKKMARYSTRYTYEQFVGCYTGRKRTIYQKAVDSLLTIGLSSRDAIIQYFVKTEKTNFTDKSDPTPRGISPRDPRYNVELGRYLKPIEKWIYKSIDKIFGARTVMKGLNASQRAEIMNEHWNHFHNPVAIGLDASRFDQHISKIALEWEHGIYRSYYPGDRKLRWLLKQQLLNRVKGRCANGKLRFVKRGTRMSGDMNTSLGNVEIMCGLIYSYMTYLGISKFRLSNDGDDCVLVVEHKHEKLIYTTAPDWFREMGFTMKMEEPVYEFSSISFCQTKPYFNGESWMLVRDVRTAITKDCISIKPLTNDKLFRRWIKSVGDGGMSLAGGVPIWQEFYMCLLRSAGDAKPIKNDPTFKSGLTILGEGMNRKYTCITQRNRYEFWKTSGIPPEAQIAIEQHYKTRTIKFIDNDTYDGLTPCLPFDW